MKNIFKINIFTYLFFLLYILSGFYKDIIIIYLILLFHEIGHYIIMKFYNIDVYNITFYPYGGMINSNMLINTNSIKVFIISLGGILSQIILYILFGFIFKLGFISYNIFNIFCNYNKYIILFNLLPIYPLDGYKIINSLLEMIFSFKKSILLSNIINVIFLIIFFVYMYMYKVSNYVIILFLLFSLFKYIKEYKYLINKFYIERIMYDIKYNGLVSVSDIDYIYKNKFNYVNGIREEEIIKRKFFNKF